MRFPWFRHRPHDPTAGRTLGDHLRDLDVAVDELEQRHNDLRQRITNLPAETTEYLEAHLRPAIGEQTGYTSGIWNGKRIVIMSTPPLSPQEADRMVRALAEQNAPDAL